MMNLFVSKGLYGERKLTHVDLYEMEPGWWFLEIGSVTVEVDNCPVPIDRAIRAAICVALWLAPSPLLWRSS